jgi:hypothetical protein
MAVRRRHCSPLHGVTTCGQSGKRQCEGAAGFGRFIHRDGDFSTIDDELQYGKLRGLAEVECQRFWDFRQSGIVHGQGTLQRGVRDAGRGHYNADGENQERPSNHPYAPFLSPPVPPIYAIAPDASLKL